MPPPPAHFAEVNAFRLGQIIARCMIVAGLATLDTGAAQPAAASRSEMPDGLYAEFTTPRGVIVAGLFYQKTPLTVTNFVGLAEGTLGPAPGKPFFDGLTFHRVVPNFVIQGGDPKGTGEGGPGYSFPDEFAPGRHHDDAGVLAMANDGPDTNGCQFFFTLREVNRLNYLHTVFGRVARGLEALPRVQAGDKMQVKILRIGAAARAFRADQAAFDALAAKTPKYTGRPEPGPEAHFYDPDHLLPAEPPRAKNFNFKLANFERATGIKIAARVFAHSPPPAEDARPGAHMHALAEKLGTARRGVLAAYFADEDDWRVWIGDDLVSGFLGRPAKPEDLGEDQALHQVKQVFLEAVQARAKDATAFVQKTFNSDQPLTAAQKLKLEVDEMLDGLIFRFEPKSVP